MTGAPRSLSVVHWPGDRPADEVAASLRSVAGQRDVAWELLVPAGTPLPDGVDAAAVRELDVTDRTRAATYAAALAVATGEHLVLLDAGVRLEPGALAALAAADDADVLYGDELRETAGGTHRVSRPVWSPVRALGEAYTGHLLAVRVAVARGAGLFATGTDGSEEHDALLRLVGLGATVGLVPHVLCVTPEPVAGRPEVPGPAGVAAREVAHRVVQGHLDEHRPGTRAVPAPVPGAFTLRWPQRDVRVSVVVPTRGGSALVWGEHRVLVVETVRSVLRAGGLDDLEVVVVYDLVTPQAVLDELRALAGDRLVLVPFDGPFNFSAKCNAGYAASSGEVVVMLNDDVDVRSPGALARLVAPLDQPDVGMTGALLLYPDDTVQHGGHVYRYGALTHALLGAWSRDLRLRELFVDRESSGLTAACVAMRREVYEAVGGFSEALPVNFNDVDLSLKVRWLGLSLLWVATADLYHFESRTRVPVVHPWETETVRGRWHIDGDDLYLPERGKISRRS